MNLSRSPSLSLSLCFYHSLCLSLSLSSAITEVHSANTCQTYMCVFTSLVHAFGIQNNQHKLATVNLKLGTGNAPNTRPSVKPRTGTSIFFGWEHSRCRSLNKPGSLHAAMLFIARGLKPLPTLWANDLCRSPVCNVILSVMDHKLNLRTFH